MNGSHVLAFIIGALLVLACQLFAAILLRKPTPTPDRDDAAKLKRSNLIAIEFILWLTPCGQCKPEPSISEIGSEARRVYNKMVMLESTWRASR